MSLLTGARPLAPLRGSREPRVRVVPPAVTSAGEDMIAVAEIAGLFLDPWQRDVLVGAMGELGDGRWAAFEVGVIVGRQNGKGGILEAREIGGLFALRERLIVHTAHQFKTSSEHFLRVRSLIENTDALRKRCKKPRTSHGEEEIETLNGCRLKFLARSRSSGRGLSGDCVVLDEAFALDGRHMGALLPTLAARPNPQIWYASSAGFADSETLSALRGRALELAGVEK
jgi:phage terminase large subunit-like protein